MTPSAKKAKLADAEEKLRVATEKLDGKRAELAAVVAKVEKLQRSFDASVEKSEKLKAEMQVRYFVIYSQKNFPSILLDAVCLMFFRAILFFPSE